MIMNNKCTDIKGVMEMFCCKRSLALKIGDLSGAKFKVGRLTRYSIEKLNGYMESLQNNN